jgi:hypothetical protein
MASVIPIAKALYLCDDILSDPSRVKPHLIGVFNAVRVPAFPHTLAKLCIFVQLVNGYGEVNCRVRIVNASNRDIMYQSPVHVVRFDDRRQTRYFRLKLTQITGVHLVLSDPGTGRVSWSYGIAGIWGRSVA